MKGMELPMNTLVIVIIAVIILIAVVVLFMNSWIQGSSGLSMDSAKNSACQTYVSLKYCNDRENLGDKISINKIVCKGRTAPVENLQDLATYCYSGITAAGLCCI